MEKKFIIIVFLNQNDDISIRNGALKKNQLLKEKKIIENSKEIGILNDLNYKGIKNKEKKYYFRFKQKRSSK